MLYEGLLYYMINYLIYKLVILERLIIILQTDQIGELIFLSSQLKFFNIKFINFKLIFQSFKIKQKN